MDRNGVVTTYTYDVANKLLAAGETSFEYDANGNLTGKTDATGTTNYTYDYENRLLSAGGVSFAYDGDGNRISKGSTYFVNDVNMPLTQALLEQDETGNTLASYTYGLELISMAKGGVTYYYIYDGLGNVVAVTDDAGQTVQTYDYDAFGNIISATGTLENPYQFIGAYGCQDDGVGLIYMRARYYAPEIGRFISRDPLWGRITNPLSLNRYVYARNNPVKYIDPESFLADIPIWTPETGWINLYQECLKQLSEKWKELKKKPGACPLPIPEDKLPEMIEQFCKIVKVRQIRKLGNEEVPTEKKKKIMEKVLKKLRKEYNGMWNDIDVDIFFPPEGQ